MPFAFQSNLAVAKSRAGACGLSSAASFSSGKRTAQRTRASVKSDFFIIVEPPAKGFILSEKGEYRVGEQAHSKLVGMVDGVHHQRRGGNASAPEAAISEGGVRQCDIVFGGELADGFDIDTRVVIDILLALEPHPVGSHIVRCQNDPLGADGLEVVAYA